MAQRRRRLEDLPQVRLWSSAWAAARNVLRSKDPTLHWVPAGHFYSPIPSWEERMRAVRDVDEPPETLTDVDLEGDAQRDLLERLAKRRREFTLPSGPTDGCRYHDDNPYFGYMDAAVYGSLLLELRPRRVVEIGSGWSSALLLDMNDVLGGSIDISFVEPYPDVLRTLLRPGDLESRLHEANVQTITPDIFGTLEADDILFIDSSHVGKAGSDLTHLLFEVIPTLKPGVWVHLHDIFYPFEYPPDWLREGRAWNENYLVRAFLAYSRAFRVRLFVNYLNRIHPDWIKQHLPDCGSIPGGSLWIQRTG